MDNQLAMEAFRRRAGQQPSAAGIPGANLNPMAGTPQGVAQPPQGQAPSLQPQQSMSQPGMDQLKKSMPGEAELIIKALIQRLRSSTPKPQPTQPSQSMQPIRPSLTA